MIYVITPDRGKASAYLMSARRVDPANHIIVTSPEDAAVCRRPTERDELVFLSANLRTWDFFQAWMRGER